MCCELRSRVSGPTGLRNAADVLEVSQRAEVVARSPVSTKDCRRGVVAGSVRRSLGPAFGNVPPTMVRDRRLYSAAKSWPPMREPPAEVLLLIFHAIRVSCVFVMRPLRPCASAAGW
jgi:hypothetical protein